MSGYPKEFIANSASKAGIQTSWITSCQTTSETITLAIPKEFEGPGLHHSPEDLYAEALLNCFVATFKFAAEKSSLNFSELKAECRLIVDLNENKSPWMKEAHFTIDITGLEKLDRAQRLVEKVKQNCLILNSVLTHKYFHITLNGEKV
jgi:organic hydroperoxide reductase OsmC/OhrA